MPFVVRFASYMAWSARPTTSRNEASASAGAMPTLAVTEIGKAGAHGAGLPSGVTP